MKKIIIILLISLGITACATSAKYQNLLDSWVGADENILIGQWGVPTSKYENDGIKFLAYIGNYGSYVGPYGTITHYTCTTTFQVKNGKVINYMFQGNSCKAK